MTKENRNALYNLTTLLKVVADDLSFFMGDTKIPLEIFRELTHAECHILTALARLDVAFNSSL